MFITRRDLKDQSKKTLKGQHKTSALVTAVSFVFPNLVGPSGVGAVLLDGPFSAGMASYFLKLIRGEAPGMGTMFQGFSRFLRNIRLWALQIVFVLLWGLLLVVPGVIAALRYSMVWFVLVDEPDLTARQALERSKELTRGHLGDLALLAASFLGWVLVGFLTLGIGFLWIVPYIQTTWAYLYEGLRANHLSKD